MNEQTKTTIKRPRAITLAMLAATVSMLALAGCGSDEPELPPQPDPIEQEQAPNDNMTSDPGMQDPALDGESATQEPMSQEPMSQEPMSQEPMSQETMPEEEAGFGEGTDPMPGADEEDDTLTQG